MNRRARTAWLLAFSCGWCFAAQQAQLGGRVADTSGGALPEAAVSAVNEDTGIRRTARSDAAGGYAIAGLEPGIYKVTARKAGFQTVTRLDVELTAGRHGQLDFALPVGSVHEVITVRDVPLDESAFRDAGAGEGRSGVAAARRLLDTLPLDGRGVLTLVELAPGVVATPASSGEAGQFSANGSRANTNAFSVDGVSANSTVTGSTAPAQFPGAGLPSMTAFGGLQTLAPLDALEEVRVETNAFAPEAGRMPGAQVRMATRSGSNEWHGSLADAWRNEALAGNEWLAASRGFGKAPLGLNQWTGTLGGPVRRDRTFFFAAWEGLRLRAPFAWLGPTPSEETRRAAPPALAPLLNGFPPPDGRSLGGGLSEYTARGSNPSRLDSGSLRIDHALSPRIALFGRYMQAPSSSDTGYTHVERASFDSRSLTVGVNAAPGAGVMLESRVKAGTDSAAAEWLDSGEDPSAILRLLRLPASGGTETIYGISIGGVGQILSGATDGNRQGQLRLTQTAGWTHGAHSWRVGVEYDRLTPSRGKPALAVAGFWPDLASFTGGAPATLAISQATQASSLIETLSLYAQDTWRPQARLTITWGARWEITPAPSIREVQSAAATASATLPAPATATSPGDGSGSTSSSGTGATSGPDGVPLWPTRYGQVAPRVAAAYRLGRNSALRAGWGIFYDAAFSAATDPINGFPFNRWQFGDAAGVSMTALPLGVGFLRNLKLPFAREWNVVWEQAIGASDFLSLGYSGSAGRQLLRREAGAQSNGAAAGSVATNRGRSDFHAMQASYRRRLARGIQAVANYTWGHSIDNGSWDSAVALSSPDYGPEADRGNSSFDVRHGFSAAVTLESRGIGRSRLWRRVTGDWKAQTIARARSGFPIDVLDTENALGLGWDDYRRPDVSPGAALWIADGSAPGGRRLNPAAFRTGSGSQGTLGRNAIAGFGMYQVDLALRRRFALADAASLEIGATCFNSMNHANPADPVRYRNSPYFGQAVSMLNRMLGSGSPRSGLTPAFQLGGPRSVEAGVKVRF